MPIPKFAKEIVKRAKAKPKVIKTSISVKKATNTKSKKLLEKDSKDDLCETIDILKMSPNDKLSGYKTGEKIKIYNKNNMNKFIEIVCPENPTFDNILELIKKVKRGEKYAS